MKKIALFQDDVTRLAFYARVSGIHERLRTCGRDISLYLFRSRAAKTFEYEYNIGEYNIYNLPDLNEFDGIILDLFNVSDEESGWYGIEATRKMIEKAKESKKPVITIGNRLEGFYHVGIDNYPAMKALFAHIYEEHQCRRFWFFMGPADNPENRQRVKAVQDYLAEHDGRDFSEYFYFHNFESETGRNGFNLFLEKYKELPEAIICANDRIAVGAIAQARSYGYRIPEDFLITGFDNQMMAVYSTPGLTTVDQNWDAPGRKCIDMFCDIWDGKEVPVDNYVETSLILRDSCGCMPDELVDRYALLNDRIFQDMDMELFDAQLDSLEYGLLNCDNLREVGEVFIKSFSFLNCKALSLVLCEKYEHYDIKEFARGGIRLDPDFDRAANFIVHGYPEDMRLVFVCRDGKLTMEQRLIHGLFPTFESEKTEDFLLMPIHFRKYTVGYLVIEDSGYVLKHALIMRAINTLTIAIENLYTKSKLRSYNRELSKVSVIDAMTGFYNRLGLQQVAVRLFDEYKQKKKNLAILFVDMDRLKYMNDCYGHKCGDLAILSICGAIRKNCSFEDTVTVRMGGDEFLLILRETDEEQIQALLERIRNTVPEMDEIRKLPYAPTVSVGYVLTDMDSEKTLDDYIREADAIMYKEKRGKKKENPL